MFYVRDLEILTTHTADNPLEHKIKCWSGVIHHVGIMARPGSSGTLRIAFFSGGHQIYPVDHDRQFVPSQYPLRFKDFLKMQQGENEITIKLWNVGATYSHVVTIEIGVLPEEEVSTAKALFMLSETLQYLGDKIRTYF